MSAVVYYLKYVFSSHAAEIAILAALLLSDNDANPPVWRLSEK
jgi:hypothetical protein